MSAIAQQTLNIINKLSESAQISLLRFARFLEADENHGDYLPYDEVEMNDDIALYDEAMANDDGYRIFSMELRKEYDTANILKYEDHIK